MNCPHCKTGTLLLDAWDFDYVCLACSRPVPRIPPIDAEVARLEAERERRFGSASWASGPRASVHRRPSGAARRKAAQAK